MGRGQHDGDHEGDSDAAVQVQVSSPQHLAVVITSTTGTLVLWHGKDGSNAVQVAQQGSAARRRASGAGHLMCRLAAMLCS